MVVFIMCDDEACGESWAIAERNQRERREGGKEEGGGRRRGGGRRERKQPGLDGRGKYIWR